MKKMRFFFLYVRTLRVHVICMTLIDPEAPTLLIFKEISLILPVFFLNLLDFLDFFIINIS